MFPTLGPSQAVVSFTQMEKPRLVSIDPAPSELRLLIVSR